MPDEYTMPDRMAWVDIETTGLRPTKDCILEVACVVTDNELTVIDAVSHVLVPTNFGYSEMIPFVHEMHTKNGLIELIESNQADEPWAVEASLRLFMEQFFGDGEDAIKPPMCGSSVHFDRAFIDHHLMGFGEMFHYRNIDVSTVKELAERWAHPVWERRPGQADEDKKHRALDDTLASIAELRYYLETGFLTRF